MNELALFAGAGGGILGGKLLGWRTVCAVEWEPYPASILAQRQNDGLLAPFPIWDDVRTFDGHAWRGAVDVVSGGFPCQDISVAGKGAGIDGARSGMWKHMARIIGEVRPRYCFVENSPAIVTRGLGRVLGDLAALGYDCRWTVLGAADISAPHQRDRFWLVGADTRCDGMESGLREAGQQGAREGGEGWAEADGVCEAVADADGVRELQPQGRQSDQRGRPGDCGCQDVAHTQRNGDGTQEHSGEADWAEGDRSSGGIGGSSWWEVEPDVGRVADGLEARVDRLKALGNGQVPQCAAAAWRLLTMANGKPYSVANNRIAPGKD